MSELILKNPHSILAALQRRPKDVLRVSLPAQKSPEPMEDVWTRIRALAQENGVPIAAASAGQDRHSRPGKGRRDPRDRDDFGRVGGSEALVRPRAPVSAEELFRREGASQGLWLALDSLQDPQNVGAIFRLASFFGVSGILMTTERSAPLSAAAYDVASGGIEDVPFTLQVNLQRAFEVAKESGLWILGTSEHAEQDLSELGPDRAWLVVLGNEERGMRRLTREACDLVCGIPDAGGMVTSLNVSTAAAVVISRLSPTQRK